MGKKKSQNFDITNEELERLREEMFAAEQRGNVLGMDCVDNSYDGYDEKTVASMSADMITSCLEKRKAYKQKRDEESCDCNETSNGEVVTGQNSQKPLKKIFKNTEYGVMMSPHLPNPKLDLEFKISKISDFNIVTLSDGLRTISIDLNTLAQSDDQLDEATETDIRIISELRLTEVLTNFYPSAIIPTNMPIKGKISQLLDFDTGKFKLYSYDDKYVMGYYISDISNENYNELVEYAINNGIFLSLMRCMISITCEDGITFDNITDERCNQMMMTSSYRDSSKVFLKLIENDKDTTFDRDTEIKSIYGLGVPYTMYYQIPTKAYRDILGDYYDDMDDSDEYDEDEDDEDVTNDDTEQTVVDEMVINNPSNVSITADSVVLPDQSDPVKIVQDPTPVPNITINGIPLSDNGEYDSIDSDDDFDDMFDDETFDDKHINSKDSVANNPTKPVQEQDDSDDQFIIKPYKKNN